MKLSIIMPAYNEQDGIRHAVDEVRQHVLDRVSDSEMIIVNDGSRDRTGEILDEISRNNPRIQVIHQPNAGHGKSLRKGLDHARGEYLFMLDSDRQIPIECFDTLWQAVQNHDAAFGRRTQRQDARIRIVLATIVRGLTNLLFFIRAKDANVPFKVIRRELWQEASQVIPADAFAPSLFLAIYAYRHRKRIAVIDTPHRDRETGEVSIRRWKLFKVCVRCLKELLLYRIRLR